MVFFKNVTQYTCILIQVKFDKLYCDFCLNFPACGRRMLKVELGLAPTSGRGGWMFNIGDSVSNDGYSK